MGNGTRIVRMNKEALFTILLLFQYPMGNGTEAAVRVAGNEDEFQYPMGNGTNCFL